MRGLCLSCFVGRGDRASRGVSLGCSFLNGVCVEGTGVGFRMGVGYVVGV